MYPKGYLEIQMIFAKKMAHLTGLPYSESLLRHSDIYGIFGLKRGEDLPVWEQFIAEIPVAELGVEQAYDFYKRRDAQGLILDFAHDKPTWGCFSYEYNEDTKEVGIHFG